MQCCNLRGFLDGCVVTEERKIQSWGTFNSFFDGMILMISQEVLVFLREKVAETNVQKPGGLNSVREKDGGG